MSAEFIYEQLSYKIIGAIYDVYNNLGSGLKEKTYKNALEVAFTKLSIPFKRELCVRTYYAGIAIGRHFYDFFIDNQVILEIKIGDYYAPQHTNQAIEYLKASKLQLALLVYFASDRVRIKRIVNLY